MSLFKRHSVCRACGNTSLKQVWSFGAPMPLANDFKKAGESHEGFVPVEILWCPACTLAQTSCVVAPERLYANYPYTTSNSETMREHFRRLMHEICKQVAPENVLEIGSNDGLFLEFIKTNWPSRVLGIDASSNQVDTARARGIESICGILDDETAGIANGTMPEPSVIIARHVFCHADDWQAFMRNLDTLANRDTIIVIEVPYLVDTIKNVEFDQAYLEHLSYLSLKAMAALLERTPFRMQKVMRFPVHGGAIAIFIRRRDWEGEPHESVEEFLAAENITLATWENFYERAWESIYRLKSIVRNFSTTGKKVVGYGASAKSTVWISACGFTKEDIRFIVDSTPGKQGRFSPGTEIEILPESALTNESADYVINWAWNFHSEICAKNKHLIDNGMKFINPHKNL